MADNTPDQIGVDEDVDVLGPVDWIVVEFPGSKFRGEIAPVLADLVDRGLIRILDLLVLKKDADGTLEAFELSDLDPSELGGLRAAETELAMLLSDEDVNALAAAIEPGTFGSPCRPAALISRACPTGRTLPMRPRRHGPRESHQRSGGHRPNGDGRRDLPPTAAGRPGSTRRRFAIPSTVSAVAVVPGRRGSVGGSPPRGDGSVMHDRVSEGTVIPRRSPRSDPASARRPVP